MNCWVVRIPSNQNTSCQFQRLQFTLKRFRLALVIILRLVDSVLVGLHHVSSAHAKGVYLTLATSLLCFHNIPYFRLF
jgi:hypothetical protein